MLPLALAAAAGLYKIGKGIHQSNLARKVKIPDADYETSPYAQKMLAEATMLKNSRMPGTQQAEQNIMGNQANVQGAIARNATSGAQALAMLSAAQGNTNEAFGNLRQQEGQYGLQTMQNWNNANQGMIYEGDKNYMDDVRKQTLKINEKNALRGAGTQNIGGGANDLINSAFMYEQMKQNKRD